MSRKGMGDQYGRQEDPFEPRYDRQPGSWGEFLKRLIQDSPPVISNEKADEMKVLDKVLKNALYNTPTVAQKQAFLDPPYEAEIVDMYKNAPFAVPANSLNLLIMTLTVRTGQFAVIQRFANLCENLAAHNDIMWAFWIDGQPLRVQTTWFDGTPIPQNTYLDFQPRLGLLESPPLLSKPIILTGACNFNIMVTNNSLNNHTVTGRCMGYLWTPMGTSPELTAPLQAMS